jgi:hypothetical protein
MCRVPRTNLGQEALMTDEMMKLKGLIEKAPDADPRLRGDKRHARDDRIRTPKAALWCALDIAPVGPC